MLKILKEQMDHFGRRATRSFEDRLVTHLTQTSPALAGRLGPDALRARVRAGMAKAERHGIVMEPDAVEFVTMLLALGPDADDELPWVREIVRDRGLDGGGKVRALEKKGRELFAAGGEQQP